MSDSNRGLHGRAHPPNLVAYLSVGKQRVTAAIDNLSSGGAFVCTSLLLPVGTVVGLELVEPGQGRTLLVSGRVVSAVDPQAALQQRAVAGVRVEFEDLSIDHHRRMSTMIEALELARTPEPAPAPPAKVELRRFARGIEPAPAPPSTEPTPSPGIKRRRNRRVPAKDMTAHVRIKDEVVALSVPVSNLSMGGLFLYLDDPLPVGAAIDVELRAAGQSLVVSGAVVGVLSPKAAAERGIIPGFSMGFGPMTPRTAERLRSSLITLAPLAADGLRQEHPPAGYLPEPTDTAPPPISRPPVIARRGDFDFEAGDLSPESSDAPQAEDLRLELVRLRAEIKTRDERIAVIEQTLRDAQS